MVEQLQAGPMTAEKQSVSEVHSRGARTKGAGGEQLWFSNFHVET